MPTKLADVDVDDLFEALRCLGNPTVFIDRDRADPDDRDVPQLLGAISATVDKLASARAARLAGQGATSVTAAWDGFAAGWLGTAGAGGGPCGGREAFDLLTARLQTCQRMLTGHRSSAPVVAAVRATLAAACAYAVVHATATAVQAGIYPSDDPSVVRLSQNQLIGAGETLERAVALHNGIVDLLKLIDPTDPAGNIADDGGAPA